MKEKEKRNQEPLVKTRWFGIQEGGKPSAEFSGLRERYVEIFEDLREGKTPETVAPQEGIPDLRELLIEYGKRRIKDEFSEDQLLIKLFGIRLELDRMINLYLEKTVVLEHLSGFPEYGNDPCRFFSLIATDTGDPGVTSVLKELSGTGQSLCSLRTVISTFVHERIHEVMPNTASLAGPDLATELLYLGGGLRNIVRLPASTIQVLGADKAFFKHMRSGTPPPKHGIIFKYPGMSSLPPKRRGRVSRTLANKLSLAIRADYFGSEADIAGMKKIINKRMEEKRP